MSPWMQKVTDRSTAEACIEIARQVQQARYLAGDDVGASAARMVATTIMQALLRTDERFREVERSLNRANSPRTGESDGGRGSSGAPHG